MEMEISIYNNFEGNGDKYKILDYSLFRNI